MKLTIDKTKGRSLYRQVRDQIMRLVDEGALQAGTKLPGTRELAEQLGISRKTVMTAYQELEARSYIKTVPMSGTFVRDRSRLSSLGPGATVENDEVDTESLTAILDWDKYRVDGDFFAMPPRRESSGDEPVNFIKALPDDRLFPFEQIKQITSTLLWYPKDYFFNYGNPQGYQPLVEYLESQAALEGIQMAEGAPGTNHIIITNGFQNALDLITTMLVREGDTVAVENPTYAAILNLLIAKKINYVGIPVDKDGMDVSRLADVMKKKNISAIITVPTYHNPTGTTMSLERRHALLKLAEKYEVPVVEDAYANALRFDGEVVPSLKSLDRGGHVIQIGSFSKSLLPGLRIGWITVPEAGAHSLFRLKRACDKSDSIFLQLILHEFIKKGHFEKHLKKTRRIYRSRRDVMVVTMKKHFPKEVKWNEPSGGLSLWVTLPEGWKSMGLYLLARERGVEFAVANFFWTGKHDSNGFRLSFAQLSEKEIEKGIIILGKLLKEAVKKPSMIAGKGGEYGEL
jgi:2-aminoadipate transaminase